MHNPIYNVHYTLLIIMHVACIHYTYAQTYNDTYEYMRVYYIPVSRSFV